MTAKSGGRAIEAVAFFEAFKGAVVLVVASGLTLLVHRDLHALAERLVAHTHLNPASRYPQIFLEAVDHLQNTRLSLLALGAAAYSALRFLEAYGLFRRAAWAEVLAALSGAIYVPFEIANLLRRFTWLSLGALVLNVLVVLVMVAALMRRRRFAPQTSKYN
jgi:uncharacterized membrane protein (DUF2068 family)